MCGRYALYMRRGQILRVLEDHGMSFPDEPNDDDHDRDTHANDNANDNPGVPHQQDGFRPSYSFAPGYQGLVCRAKSYRTDNRQPGAPDDDQQADHASDEHYKLQTMKWGLVPSWTKRRPDYATTLKTINCRADSLAAGGMWTLMRGKKRCVVVAQGFYEWAQAGPKERVPYYIRRHDGLPLLFAGLWDCVSFKNEGGGEEQKLYTYTIITTDSNKSMHFLHNRMPVIFDLGSSELRTWLDPNHQQWSTELQALLRPWPNTDGPKTLDIDVVSKDVNKAGRSSPTFIIPVASRDNKSNIANFFSSPNAKVKNKDDSRKHGYDAVGGDESKPVQSTSNNTSASASTPTKKRKIIMPHHTIHGDTSTQKKQSIGQPLTSLKTTPGKRAVVNQNAGKKITAFFSPNKTKP